MDETCERCATPDGACRLGNICLFDTPWLAPKPQEHEERGGES